MKGLKIIVVANSHANAKQWMDENGLCDLKDAVFAVDKNAITGRHASSARYVILPGANDRSNLTEILMALDVCRIPELTVSELELIKQGIAYGRYSETAQLD